MLRALNNKHTKLLPNSWPVKIKARRQLSHLHSRVDFQEIVVPCTISPRTLRIDKETLNETLPVYYAPALASVCCSSESQSAFSSPFPVS